MCTSKLIPRYDLRRQLLGEAGGRFCKLPVFRTVRYQQVGVRPIK
jgi:hypothetical protein